MICLLEMNVVWDVILIVLGGGVIGDLCGFVVVIYQWGVFFIQVFIILLLQVDLFVGGKIVVNYFFGKNMIGVFYQFVLVVIDIIMFNILLECEFVVGMVEVIKYGIIYDVVFFDWLEVNQ